ncbi:hypothetical protein Golob_024976 [Gossypium lobatum]|uniref:Uncharacterized protein n=1 Tax=Gossypium lobatum TaxID=34289 RepID=A0A7J8NKD7_9ROSI|nr:hypothetical protein [Gossypium lobatum]
MEDTSSAKEVTLQGTPAYYFPKSFHEVVGAILRCLGLETGFQQNPNPCPKKEDNSKANHNQPISPKENADPPSSTDNSDPSTTVIEPPAGPPPSPTGDTNDGCLPMVSLFTPKKPGPSHGSGPQIN